MSKFESFEEAYYHILKTGDSSVTILNPRKNLIYRPNLHLYALIGEFILNLQGNCEVDALKHYTPAYARITDEEKVNGMIGDRIFNYDCMFDIYMQENPDTKEKEFKCDHIITDQFVECLQRLTEYGLFNMSIYNKVFDDIDPHPSDIQNILWYLDNKNLCCTVNTGVFDIYTRMPYLAFFISNLMAIMACKLKCEIGQITVNFGYIVQSHNAGEEKFIYKKGDILDINGSDDNELLKNIYELEAVSRVESNLLSKEEYESKLKDLQHPYYQSLMAILLNFNTPYDFDEYITEEFKRI